MYPMKATPVTAGKGSQKPAGLRTLNRVITALGVGDTKNIPPIPVRKNNQFNSNYSK
jgi:hypothetical protein